MRRYIRLALQNLRFNPDFFKLGIYHLPNMCENAQSRNKWMYKRTAQPFSCSSYQKTKWKQTLRNYGLNRRNRSRYRTKRRDHTPCLCTESRNFNLLQQTKIHLLSGSDSFHLSFESSGSFATKQERRRCKANERRPKTKSKRRHD